MYNIPRRKRLKLSYSYVIEKAVYGKSPIKKVQAAGLSLVAI